MDEELYSLIRKLRDESTFVQSEKKHLIEQFRQLLKKSEQLFHKQWIINKQHLILDDLILGRNKLTTSQCCTRFALLANRTQFGESHKTLGYNDYQVSEFVKALRDRPAHLARLLVRSERYTTPAAMNQLVAGLADNQVFSTQQLIPIVFQSLYGNCTLLQDEILCLQLLKHIMELQFGGAVEAAVDLRRLIRKQSCSFNILFKFYISFTFSAQLFLTAALYEPISHMLTQEWYLDIDPDKALGRFTSEEFTKRFGPPNTKEHKMKIQRYREKIVAQLYSATMAFIDSINANLFCFPTPLAWLVNQLYQLVNRTSASSNQADISRKLCCDLIMALYICPAICDPEPYGVISDIQMSVYARHNLMQIANILQVLAMSDDDKDPKAQDLYSKFRNNCVSDILNNIILTQNSQSAGAGGLANLSDAQTLSEQAAVKEPSQADLNAMFASNPSYLSTDLQASLTRASVMISPADLHKILIYFRQICRDASSSGNEPDEIKWLKELLPNDYINQTLENAAQTLNSATIPRHSSLTLNNSSSSLAALAASNASSTATASRGSLMPAPPTPPAPLTPDSVEVVLSVVREPAQESIEGAQVLVICINDKGLNCPGMLSEEKVLSEAESAAAALFPSAAAGAKSSQQRLGKSCHRDLRGHRHRDLSPKGSRRGKAAKLAKRHQSDETDPLDSSFGPGGGGGVGGGGSVIGGGGGGGPGSSSGAKIRSCLSSDAGIDRDDVRSRHDGSVEGISEVCETNECRSISSNDEDDDVNEAGGALNDEINDEDDDGNPLEADDGLSDFDNFSGRDTPIISGRDTPSSHSHEDLQNTSSSRNLMAGAGPSGAGLNDPASLGAGMIMAGSSGGVGAGQGRGPQLPVTVQKANREDINDKFCKFEINKINAPVKEEQLSEAWSLDADPPESVNNEPINDPLGLLIDENSSNSNLGAGGQAIPIRSGHHGSAAIMRTPSTASNAPATPTSSVASSVVGGSVASVATTATSAGNLINFGDPEPLISAVASAVPSMNGGVKTTTAAALANVASANNLSIVPIAVAAALSSSENDPNLDDRYSVVSDSAAWSTDLINNSDSDLESNSPSKYTPYSTYSSNSSHTNQHPSIINNSNLISDFGSSSFNSATLTQSQSQSTFLLNNNASVAATGVVVAAAASPNSFNSPANDLIKGNVKSVDSGLNSWSYSDSTSLAASSNPADAAGKQQQSPGFQTPPASGPVSSNPNSSSSSSNKHRLSSIFSSNSNGVKFSLSGNSSASGNNQQKRGRLQRIFNIKPSSSSSSSNSKGQTSDPFASIAPNLAAAQAEAAQTAASQPDSNIDNILKKYANKTATPPAPAPPVSAGAAPIVGTLIDLSTPVTSTLAPSQSASSMLTTEGAATTTAVGAAMTNGSLASSSSLAKNFSTASLPVEASFYDAANQEHSKLFLDAKKKLRIVLSWSDCSNFNFMPMNQYKNPKENFITMYLKTQLYEAIGLQDKEKEAQLYETIRCMSAFSEQDCHKLLRSLRKDYLKRMAYMTYLTKSKQSVLFSLNLIEKLLQRSEWHQRLRTHQLASVVTRIFLETKENEQTVYGFVQNFRQLVAVDEKFDLFKKCLQTLYADFDAIWNGCDEEMLQLGHLYMERLLMSKVYTFAMFPNGEIDHYRDSKVSECFAELANVMTPAHPLIGIAPIYHQECPWTAAQMELRRLNIYKTPQDKLACIHKCLITIQNLLAIAKSPVCADDLHPVLIYVIIKANPPTFLSNVQYIEGFYGSQLESEDYYWAQFIFAFSYIKAKMLNRVAGGAGE